MRHVTGENGTCRAPVAVQCRRCNAVGGSLGTVIAMTADVTSDAAVDAFAARVAAWPVEVPADLADTVTVRKRTPMYLGGAAFCAFAPEDDEVWLEVSTGFDCWSMVSTVHADADTDVVLGVLVTTYGPWTAAPDGKAYVELLERAPQGAVLPAGLLLAGLADAIAGPFLQSYTRDVDDVDALPVPATLCVQSRSMPDEPEDAELTVALPGDVRAFCLDAFGDLVDTAEPYADWDWLEMPVLLVNAAGAAMLGLPWE